MMKVKGNEYPVSLFKIVLADQIADKLEFIRTYLTLPNNIEAFSIAINTTHKILLEQIKLERDRQIDTKLQSIEDKS